MPNQIIGVDVDGVLRDFVGSLIRVYKRIYPDHEVKEITDFSLNPFFPIGKGINKFAFVDHAEEIYSKASAYPGAIESMNTLVESNRERGFRTAIVTSQPTRQMQRLTLHWLHDHGVDYDAIYFTHKKSEVNLFILVDDSVDNLEDAGKAGIIPVCIDRSWNRLYPAKFRFESIEGFAAWFKDKWSGRERFE